MTDDDLQADLEAELQDTPPEDARKPVSVLGRMLGAIVIIFVLVAAGAVSYYYLANRPEAKPRPPKPEAILVTVQQVQPSTYPVTITAMGTVVPARAIQLAARVSGQIIDVNEAFTPGGYLTQGKPALRIDPSDYTLALQQRASELVRAQSDLKVEMGRQAMAVQEARLLGRDMKEEDKELLLRKPQLAMSRAAVASAEAAVAKAKLDLDRTTVPTPFNAVVRSRNVELGSQVAVGTPLADLVGTDEYWVQVSIPMDQLRWIRIPGQGASVGSGAKVYCESAWGADLFRSAVVARLMTDLEPQGRMARLLVTVKDPLQLKSDPARRYPLILDAYVRVEITGRDLTGVVKIPRTALRDGKRVWVMTADDALDIRTATVLFSTAEFAYLSKGLAAGDKLVLSGLGAPVQSMPLRIAKPKAAASEPATAPAAKKGAAK